MKDFPEVLENLCVTCCCCQELCPTGAMEVRRVTVGEKAQ
jgi:formate hydrogenlyase subunit 6/NADH:ubiquinone oxidoreductase subunit I